MWADAVQYVLSSSISYAALGLLLYAAGRILDVIQRGKAAGNENITEEVSINLIEEKTEEKDSADESEEETPEEKAEDVEEEKEKDKKDEEN